jgi:hypothetical protein
MLGITAHNMGVIYVLAGRDHLALPLFEEALALKRKAFGHEHPEVAVSLLRRKVVKSSCAEFFPDVLSRPFQKDLSR